MKIENASEEILLDIRDEWDGCSSLYRRHKETKKSFAARLRALSVAYENSEITKAVKLAEVDRNAYWRLVKRARGSQGIDSISISIRDTNDRVVYEVDDVFQVWKKHFQSLGTPKVDSHYDKTHFRIVSRQVDLYNSGGGEDLFLGDPFTVEEMEQAIKSLNKGKACGKDGISPEHLAYAGKEMAKLHCCLYNQVRDSEYIRRCFRVGIQVPLRKGKGACTLDPNSYWGITLLSVFNKVFETLIWRRMEDWWGQSEAVSGLQSACRKGLSCLNTAFVLRESIATSMEGNSLVYVAYFDVAKAFDSVWIDGLFFQLLDIGVRGKTWRLLYQCYLEFWCVATVQGHVSDWYQLKCGIHQGVYMSLIKYTAFINSLVVSLQNSGLCGSIGRTPSAPVGYADDLVACCLTERKLDGALQVVYHHGCTWRYQYNAKKSGIMKLLQLGGTMQKDEFLS